jgi:hypothetical protein
MEIEFANSRKNVNELVQIINKIEKMNKSLINELRQTKNIVSTDRKDNLKLGLNLKATTEDHTVAIEALKKDYNIKLKEFQI